MRPHPISWELSFLEFLRSEERNIDALTKNRLRQRGSWGKSMGRNLGGIVFFLKLGCYLDNQLRFSYIQINLITLTGVT